MMLLPCLAPRTVTWGRLADDLCMFPTPNMVKLVDKKFGGELTKADVLGVEVSCCCRSTGMRA